MLQVVDKTVTNLETHPGGRFSESTKISGREVVVILRVAGVSSFAM